MLFVSKLTSILVATLVITGLVLAFVFSFLLNKKTPKPEGCENLEENCEGCQVTSCSHRIENKEEEEL